MKFRILSSAGALAMCFAAANAVATEYDYEGSVAYGHSNSDTVSAVVIGGVPMPLRF